MITNPSQSPRYPSLSRDVVRRNQGSVRLKSEYQTTVSETRIAGGDTKGNAGYGSSKCGGGPGDRKPDKSCYET